MLGVGVDKSVLKEKLIALKDKGAFDIVAGTFLMKVATFF